MRCTLPLALACGASALLASAHSAPAHAGTLQVNPVLVQINADRRTGTVTVRNEESSPITIRAYPLEWRQADGEDRYGETSAVIVSPPIFTIPAGGTQLVRVGLRNAAAAPQAYRLIIEEVPQAQQGQGIRVALRLNLPLYSGVRAGEAGDLRWSAARRPDGSWTVEAVNGGAGYVRVDAEMALNATGIRFQHNGAPGTVLPGAARRWVIGSAPDIQDRARFLRIQQSQRAEDRAATPQSGR
jgi:fimbrial chaperone protein